MEEHQKHLSPKNLRNKIVLISTFIIAIVGYSCWEYLQHFLERYYTKDVAEEKAVHFFFVCIEVAFAGYTFLIKELLINEKDKYIKQFSEFIFLTTVAAVVDRLFGDPYVISVYEYIVFFLTILISFKWKIPESTNWKKRWKALRQRLTVLKEILTK